jgi:branched-chain amino acid transport system ATP-binding protein
MTMPGARAMLDVSNVTKQFGNLIAVGNVSMQVAPGELRAIIGPNGAGKTTFFNMISGFFAPTSGEIVFDGDVVTRLSVTARVARGMARTFQITEIFPELTVRENIRIGVESARGLRLRFWLGKHRAAEVDIAIEEALEQTGLSGKADRMVGELSHGDQRAAEIATALTLKPRLLLLDEPTAGMGEHETYAVANLIRRLHKNSAYTIVLIEHDMRVVFNLADRITVLAEGKLLAEGTPAEISASPVVQEAYLGKAE